MNRNRHNIVTLLALAFLAVTAGPALAQSRGVLTGIDVLEKQAFKALDGKRVGLITNHTGRNLQGKSTVQVLASAPNVKLTALFSPEHGFEGKLDISKVGDSKDASTGLKVHSLYGETRKPTKAMLEDIDVVVFDIQDIGARFYTYPSTMGEAMQAAAENGKEFMVLDRPNPINGVDIAGPMLDPGKESFVGFHHLPVRHGMTTGELARLFQKERKLEQLKLTVVACEGWERKQPWDTTSLVWVNPSPNMRSLTQAWLYPGIGLLETTNVSVGRGTDTPFEVIGAPWLDGVRLADALRAQAIPGAAFVPIEFTPTGSKFANQKCGGINVIITDRNKYEPVRTGFEIAVQLRKLHPDAWEAKGFLRLLGNQETFDAVLNGKSAEEVTATASKGVEEFQQRRAAVLLYK
jgi:uncharacterized protein YbbC (DUF1343 family)